MLIYGEVKNVELLKRPGWADSLLIVTVQDNDIEFRFPVAKDEINLLQVGEKQVFEHNATTQEYLKMLENQDKKGVLELDKTNSSNKVKAKEQFKTNSITNNYKPIEPVMTMNDEEMQALYGVEDDIEVGSGKTVRIDTNIDEPTLAEFSKGVTEKEETSTDAHARTEDFGLPPELQSTTTSNEKENTPTTKVVAVDPSTGEILDEKAVKTPSTSSDSENSFKLGVPDDLSENE